LFSSPLTSPLLDYFCFVSPFLTFPFCSGGRTARLFPKRRPFCQRCTLSAATHSFLRLFCERDRSSLICVGFRFRTISALISRFRLKTLVGCCCFPFTNFSSPLLTSPAIDFFGPFYHTGRLEFFFAWRRAYHGRAFVLTPTTPASLGHSSLSYVFPTQSRSPPLVCGSNLSSQSKYFCDAQ